MGTLKSLNSMIMREKVGDSNEDLCDEYYMNTRLYSISNPFTVGQN